MFHQGPISANKFVSLDAAQFCLCKNPKNCLLLMNKSANQTETIKKTSKPGFRYG